MNFLLIAGFPDSLINFRGPLLQALVESGLKVYVTAPDLPEDSVIRKKLEDMNIKVYEIPLQRTGVNPLADISAIICLWRLMLQIKPDYVLGYTIKPVVYGALAAWLARVPKRFALITGLGYTFQNQPGNKYRAMLRLLVQKLYSFSLKRVQLVFFQNPDDQVLFREMLLLPEHVPSRVVNGSGIDVARFVQAPLPEGPLRFLLIARLLGNKGVREYAEAAKLIKSCHPEAIFQLVGWIDDNPDAIKQAELEAWITAGTLDFLGKLSDVRTAIAEASVYVLPSYREGTPRTVLEAMAMGRAVITTDAPGCRETVIDGGNGYLVPIKNVDALASAMLRFIEQPELVAEMGQRSREIAEEKYDVQKVNGVMLEEMGI